MLLNLEFSNQEGKFRPSLESRELFPIVLCLYLPMLSKLDWLLMELLIHDSRLELVVESWLKIKNYYNK